ncbi:MAG: NAD(P)H-dependent oxidoreductase [Bacteroidota bacterium]|nr:NAD(P)H-dependent oxidoreductase [Bacteroidota bacterium]
MSETIHVLGISGSLRKSSYNTALLRAAEELLPQGVTWELYDLSPLPIYNADVEAAGAPESVLHFKSRIAAADALLIATPEYNYSVSGALKNAIDWASRPPQTTPLNGKPLAIMSAGGSMGGLRAQYHLRQIAVFTNMLPLNKPELIVQAAPQKFDANGKLVDEETRQRLRELLDALKTWTLRLRNGMRV